jgi:two-component system sensor histidine kinase PilS (NtrC family)
LIFLLLLASWWWTRSYLELPIDDFPEELFLFFIVSVGLTVLYFFVLKVNKNLRLQLRFQFLFDVFLITWLVWKTGGITSPYVTLYIILICVGSFFLGKSETLSLSVLCAACFTILSALAVKSYIYSFEALEPPSRFLQIVAFNDVAFLIVGLMSARFSDRRKITAQLRETEHNFTDLHVLHESIVRSIRAGIITTDLEGKIYDVNRATEEIFRLSAADIIGQSIFSFFGEEIRMQIETCLENVLGNEFSTENFEAELQLAFINQEQAQRVRVNCSIAPLISKTNSVYGIVLTFQDVTRLRMLEDSLRRADRLAAVGRMSAGLAHEIRNPLGAMSSAIQFLQERIPTENLESSLMDVILNESDRLNKIITNFLTYARPADTVFTEIDVREVIIDTFTLIRHSPEIKETHILEYDLPENPVMIAADSTQLKQIFWNLARNSIQAMPQGGKLTVKLKEFPGKYIQISVDDTGEGISPEYLKHLFEPFSSESKGTGLGLSIVNKIVLDHGGRIAVQSEQGHGTKIIIELTYWGRRSGPRQEKSLSTADV